MSQHMPGKSILSKYGFLSVTLSLFIASLAGQWALAWPSFVSEQTQHQEEPQVRDFVIETARHTLENWRSESLLKAGCKDWGARKPRRAIEEDEPDRSRPAGPP